MTRATRLLTLSLFIAAVGCVPPEEVASEETSDQALAAEDELLRRWAPINYQAVSDGSPRGLGGRADYMTRVDYDENDHCCQRFALADGWLRRKGLQREGRVGNADARLIRARDVVTVVREQLARDPLVFLHDADSGCAECNEARQSIVRRKSLARGWGTA